MRDQSKPWILGCLASLALMTSACTTVSATSGESGSAEPSTGASEIAAVPVNQAARDLLPEKIKKKGVITMASDPTYPPFEYYDTDNTTMIGWDVDMGDAIAQALGLKAKHVPATFATILPGLSSGKYDLGMSTFSITEERKKIVDFVPYLSGGTGLAVPTGNPKGLSMDAMTMCGKKIAAQKGSIQGLEILPKLSKQCKTAGEPAIKMRMYPAQSDANLALTSGRMDGVMADSISLAYQGSLSNNQFELAPGEDYEPELTGVAVPKKSPLYDAVAEAMKGIIKSPVYEKINAKWSIPDSAVITTEVVSDAQQGRG